MKRLIALILSLAFLCSLASCGGKTDDGDTGGEGTLAASPYGRLIEQYTDLVCAKSAGKELSAPLLGGEAEAAVYEVVRDYTGTDALGYATKDIDKNGTEELVLMTGSNKIFALFTVKNGAPVLLLKMSTPIMISKDGTVYAKNKGSDYHHEILKRLVEGKLAGFEFGHCIKNDEEYAYKIEDGTETEITSEEYFALDRYVQTVTSYYNCYFITKRAGFRFIPARAEKNGTDAPAADFSSYDAILSAYRAIVDLLPEYKDGKWVNNEYDNLYAFSDNQSYAVFHTIFDGVRSVIPRKTYFGLETAENPQNAYGYSIKDMNGDGVEELILLNDRFTIIAMFTVKDGKAVLLEDAYGAWLDENGYIHKEIETYYSGKDLFLYEIKDGALSCLFSVGYSRNSYLEKVDWHKIENGTNVPISEELGEELYDRFYSYPNGWLGAEYTKSAAALRYIPLFEKATADQVLVSTYEKSGWINGSSLEISAIDEYEIAFSFTYIYTVGEALTEDYTVYETTVSGTATREGDRYLFACDGVEGYIELAMNALWLTVLESENEHMHCRVHLFNYPSGL